MTNFDITKSPFSQFENYKPPVNDGIVSTQMHLVIKHFPVEEFILKECIQECNVKFREIIADTFKKYKIDKPKDDLIML